MDSTSHVVIAVDRKVETSPVKSGIKEEKKVKSLVNCVKMTSINMRKVAHSFKVGLALVVVSLLYLIDPLYDQVGENAMWAIMTVVVIFEFYAGATLGKGLNRGIGTILGGGMGCLAASFAQQVGGTGNSIIVGLSVFVIGALATYTRLKPSIKKKYDYGAMIFILTFNLVVVSGLRAEKVLELARERLSTIGMGFAVCVFISLFVFPIWASDELHNSIASNFKILAQSIEGGVDEYFMLVSEKESQPSASNFGRCKSVLNSKAKVEQLANFAKWEPWHGKFGLHHPWRNYLLVGELLRDLAASTLSLEVCIQSPRQPSSNMRQAIKEPSAAVGVSLAWILRELGNDIKQMKKFQRSESIEPKIKAMRIELNSIVSTSHPYREEQPESIDGLAVSSFVFLLMEIVEKVDEIAKEVEELGQLASFSSTITTTLS